EHRGDPPLAGHVRWGIPQHPGQHMSPDQGGNGEREANPELVPKHGGAVARMFVVAAMSGMDIGDAEAAVPPMVSVSPRMRPVPRPGHHGMLRVSGLRWGVRLTAFSVPMMCMCVGVVFIVLMSYSSILHASSVGILYAFHHGLVHSDQPLQPRRVGLHVAGELAPLQPR